MHRVLGEPSRGACCLRFEVSGNADPARDGLAFDLALSATLYALPSLRAFKLESWTRGGIKHVLRALTSCRRLRELHLNAGGHWEDNHAGEIVDTVAVEDMASVIGALQELSNLELSCPDYGEAVWIVPLPVDPIVAARPSIAHLLFDGCVLVEDAFTALAAACAPLRSIVLKNCDISTTALDQLLDGNGSSLLRLSLCGRNLPSGSLARAAPSLANLQLLELDAELAGPGFWSVPLKRLRVLFVRWVNGTHVVPLTVGIYEMWPRLHMLGIQWYANVDPRGEALEVLSFRLPLRLTRVGALYSTRHHLHQ